MYSHTLQGCGCFGSCNPLFLQIIKHFRIVVKTGQVAQVQDKRRYIPVHEICQTLYPTFIRILPAFHVLTGADTTAVLYGKEKMTCYNVVQKDPEKFSLVSSPGENDISAATSAARNLVEAVYDPSGKEKKAHGDLNKLKTRFARHDTSIASFAEKFKRSMLQTKLCMSAHIAKPVIGSPPQHVWKRESTLVGGDILEPVQFQDPMASELLDSLVCSCSGKTLCSRTSVCKEHNMGCTELCPNYGSADCHNILFIHKRMLLWMMEMMWMMEMISSRLNPCVNNACCLVIDICDTPHCLEIKYVKQYRKLL